MTIDFTWNSTWDSEFELNISNLELEFSPNQPHPLFDGISDFSIVVSNIATTLNAVLRNRIQSMINAQMLTPKINTIANKIIKLFPAQIPFGPLILDGFLAGKPVSNPEYAVFPLATQITSTEFPYSQNCTIPLPDHLATDEY